MSIDFTNCEIDITSKYEGSDQKRGIIYQGKRYMLKFSDRIPEDKRNNLNSSYSNSVYSEYISCEIIKSMGYDVQNTLLGTITSISSTGEEKITPVVACENFLNDNEELIEFKKIQNALQFEKPGKIPKIEEIYELLNKDNEYINGSLKSIALERYWDTFIIDSLLGNFDRHGNNWGYIINKDTKEIRLAPIYDCGSCLYPQIADNAINDILNNKEEIKTRILKFPNAALESDGQKINYFEYINSLKNDDCTKALLRVFPEIDFKKIEKIIDNTEEISPIRKIFYKTMMQARLELILEPSYKKASQQMKNITLKTGSERIGDFKIDTSVTPPVINQSIEYRMKDAVQRANEFNVNRNASNKIVNKIPER